MEAPLLRREEDLEEEEVGLLPRRPRQPNGDTTSTTVSAPTTNGTPSKPSNGDQAFNYPELATNGKPGLRSIAVPEDGGSSPTDELDSTRDKGVVNTISETNGLPTVSSSLPFKQSIEEQITQDTSSRQVTAEQGSASLTSESRKIVTELYLKSVYEKPGPHEFYCPNCRACIQKVIVETAEREPSPDEFRCTSCFSFLIPAGNWFIQKLTGRDMKDGEETDVITPSRDISVNKVPGVRPVDEVNKPSVVGHTDSGVLHEEGKTSSEGVGLDHGTTGYQEAGNEAQDHSRPDSTEPEGDEIYGKGKLGAAFEGKKTGGKGALAAITGILGGVIAGKLSDEIKKRDKDGKGALDDITNVPGGVTAGKHSDEKREKDKGGKGALEAIIDIPGPVISGKLVDQLGKGPVEEELPESVPNLGLSETAAAEHSEANGAKGLEILKSIVYGGLTESIASLSVVTSAISADVAALNIVALALANLFGGLFIIVHNLWDLKAEQPRASNESDEQVDRYQELLGRKENFLVHATVVVLSFVFFGLVPPVVYGYSFEKIDDKDYMLAAIAAASLLCIIALGIGKAHIHKKSYIVTVMYYVSIGFSAAGGSYIAGNLFKKLVEQLGWFNQPDAPVGNFLGQMSFERPGPAWASS